MCLKCGNPLDREGIYCAECRRVINSGQHDRREWYREHGICPRCGKNDIMGDEGMCPECRARSYEVNMRSRERLGKDHYNATHSQWARNEHQRRIAEGICTRCGKRKADGGYKTCGICRERDRNKKLMKYGKPDRKDRAAQGLCFFCDNPIKDGYKVCEKHYQMCIAHLDDERCKKATEKMKKQMNVFYRR